MRIACASLVLLLCACSKDDAATSPTDSGTDAPPVTTPATDAATTMTDAGMLDADATVACVPADVSSLVAPPWIAATPLHQGACSASQITQYLFDCLSATATTDSCAPFNAAGKTTADARCGACIVSTSASSAGPVILSDGATHLNVAGCIANAQGNPQAGTDCARAFAVLDVCHTKSCNAACGTNTPACATASNAAACKPYADAATQCIADAGAAVVACLAGTTFPQQYDALAALWCGGALDGGAGDAN